MAMTPGYAFTDYKSQGQTIEYVLVDLEPPPTSALTPFNAYVVLPRRSSEDNRIERVDARVRECRSAAMSHPPSFP
ncbi:hypothetical protein B0H17DRAFT_1019165 [Mycena rosella]|uniref:Uncharacterized protein n=1 Tax=Mycena rosella TaxID=1033263 RepID=A0AAD7CWU9_MYCRO|nr:hypothetical protein B0H17DRAFT_1019165 [Mycena rosella]